MQLGLALVCGVTDWSYVSVLTCFFHQVLMMILGWVLCSNNNGSLARAFNCYRVYMSMRDNIRQCK